MLSDGVKGTDTCRAEIIRTPRKRFVIFYSDGSVVEDDGKDVEVTFKIPRAWAEAPRDGVQFVVGHRSDGRLQVMQNNDIYAVMPNGDTFCTNDLGPLLRTLGIAKYGLWIPDEEYFALREKVRKYRADHETKG